MGVGTNATSGGFRYYGNDYISMDTYSSSRALTTIWKFGWWYDWGHKGASGCNATRPATNGLSESYESLGFRL